MEDLGLRLDELRKWQRELEDEITSRRTDTKQAEEKLARLEARLEVFKLAEGLSEDSGMVELSQQREEASEALEKLKEDPRVKDIQQILATISQHERLLQQRYQVQILQHHE